MEPGTIHEPLPLVLWKCVVDQIVTILTLTDSRIRIKLLERLREGKTIRHYSCLSPHEVSSLVPPSTVVCVGSLKTD